MFVLVAVVVSVCFALLDLIYIKLFQLENYSLLPAFLIFKPNRFLNLYEKTLK